MLLLNTGCNQAPTPPTANATPKVQVKPLTSATINWGGHAGHYVAAKKGLFATAGVKVEDLFFPSSSEMSKAFLAGDVDIAWLTTADAVQMSEKDPTIQIIYLPDYSNGADGIIGRGIKSPKDLKGKTIAVEDILYEKVFLQGYLKKAGLKESDVKIRYMVAADAAAAFASKQVDVAVTYDPYLATAVKKGGGAVLLSTRDTNFVADAVVVRKKLIETRKPELQAYLRAIDQATKLVNSEDPEALKIAAEKMGVSVAEAKIQLKGVRLFDVDGNKKIGFNESNPNSIMGNLRLTIGVASDLKLISKPIDIKSLYDTSIVDSL